MKPLFQSILLFSLFITTLASAQQLDLDQFKEMSPRSIGPAGMSGRVTCIDVNLQNDNIIYIGTGSGGVWKSESGGIDWTPLFDDEVIQSIGAIQINQNNPSEIWVGTGEGNPRNSQNSGAGVYKSIDAGKTWQLMGLEDTKVIHRLAIHPQDSKTVYVGAQGSAWGASEDRGVYKTTDGGQSWDKILYVDDNVGVADMVVDPTNPNKIIVAMWEFGRKPYTFNSGGKKSAIYITYDGGENWKKIKQEDGLPKGNLGRIGLAIAPSKPNIVYALIEAKTNGLYKSTDGGHKWSLVSEKNIGNRPFYYADLFVDSKNENRIFNLHSIVTISQDGGKTFENLLPFYSHSGVHPDHHAFWIHPEKPNYMMNGNDGGFNLSRDGGKTWKFSENLPLAQFYHINYDMETPYNVCGGMQDNGSWVGPSQVWKRGGIKNEDWQEVLFGDGFDVVIKPNDTRYGYAMYQGGNVHFFDKKTGQQQNIKPIHPDGVQLRFNWNAAIAQHPSKDCGVYYGSQFVHKSLDCGQSWDIISPDLTTNDPEKQKQGESGGLTIDATNAENYTTIIAIAPSPVDEDVIWVGTDDGNVQLTKDGGNNWENLASRLPNCPNGAWIPQIEVSQKNAGEAFVVVNDYRRNNWTPYLYHTTDYGTTWTRLVNEKSVNGHCMSVVQDPEAENLLFLGTDQGLYLSIDKGQNWQQWTEDFPSVCVSDLKIHPREHDLIIGTFGRAAYIMDDIRPLREMAKINGKIKNNLTVFKAPDAYLANYRSIDGARFIADANFVGENRPSGALISFFIKKEEKTDASIDTKSSSKKKEKKKKSDELTTNDDSKKEEAKKEEDKVKVYIFNENNDTLRYFSTKVDTGLNRITWDLREKGIRYPSYEEPKEDANDPRGVQVFPGQYKVVLNYKDQKDSTMVNVFADPRTEYSIQDLQARKTAIQEFEKMVDSLNQAFKQLKSSKKTIDLVESQLVNVPDSLKKEIIDEGKTMRDTMNNMIHQVLMPKDFKGIDSNYPALSNDIWRTSSYVYDSKGAMNATTQIAVQQIKEKIKDYIEQVNGFFENEWLEYQEKVNGIEYSLFKEYEAVKME